MTQQKPAFPASSAVIVKINDIEIPTTQVKKFEWSSKVNSGYAIVAEIIDPNFALFDSISKSNSLNYLEEGRQKPTKIEWQFFHISNPSLKTEKRIAYLVSLELKGTGQSAAFSFYGQDPPTFLLSAGVADGRVYRGKIGGKNGVISKCIKEFTKLKDKEESEIKVDVTETNDSENGIWPMFRMDPKTYIRSLLEWSSPLTKNKESRWIISCNDDKINIKKASDLKGKDLGVYTLTSTNLLSNDIIKWNINMYNFMTQYQARLVSCGISSTTGNLIEAVVDDKNTKNKVTSLKKGEGKDRAFTKPKSGKDWPVDLPATFIRSIPEHSGGEVYKKYADYIDGRARQIFDDMLSNITRMTICVAGMEKVDTSDLLGVSTCTLNWPKASNEPWFVHGKWIVDGFVHKYSRTDQGGLWQTFLSLYRIDWDAEAIELSPPPVS